MARFARFVALLSLLGLAACSGLPPSSVRLAPVGEELPPIFGALNWNLTRTQAKSLFPGKEARDDIPGYMDREPLVVTSIWGLQWRDFGPASAHVFHDGSGRVRQLMIETEEPRQACNRFEGRPAPKDLACRTDYGVQITSVFDRLTKRYTETYGKPESVTGIFDDYPDDKRQRFLRWRRKGFDLSLAMTRGEFGDWAVTLDARRRSKK